MSQISWCQNMYILYHEVYGDNRTQHINNIIGQVNFTF